MGEGMRDMNSEERVNMQTIGGRGLFEHMSEGKRGRLIGKERVDMNGGWEGEEEGYE